MTTPTTTPTPPPPPETTRFKSRSEVAAPSQAEIDVAPEFFQDVAVESPPPEDPTAPAPYNQAAWDTLEKVDAIAPAEAVLLVWDAEEAGEPTPAWQFLINPQQLQWNNSANYQTVETLAATAKHWQFSNTSGRTLKIPNLIMNVWCYGRTLKTVVDGAEQLLKAKVKENEYAPPLLRFRWGDRDFGPCVLTDIEYTESQWRNGQPSAMQISLTLQEVERPLTEAEREQQLKQRRELLSQQNLANGKPPQPLTERQQTEAKTKALDHLKATKATYSADVQKLIGEMVDNKNTDAIAVNAQTGELTLKDLGRIGQYNGTNLSTDRAIVTLPEATE